MNPLLTDPVVLICGGVILVGLVCLIWAIGKFRRLKAPAAVPPRLDDLAAEVEGLPRVDFSAPAMTPPAPVAPPAPAVAREVADRLDGMTQRLAEMQAVLLKQSSAAPADSGTVGQGFSPETIDKLLKIIGNVMQQVDILQKNIHPTKEPGLTAAAPESAPGAKR